MPPAAEDQESLWRLVLAPSIWVVHFGTCYTTAALWCAKVGRTGSLEVARWLALAYTLLALAAIGYLAWNAWKRRVGFGKAVEGHRDTPESRHVFLALAQVLLSGLSAFGVVYVGLPFGFIATCQ